MLNRVYVDVKFKKQKQKKKKAKKEKKKKGRKTDRFRNKKSTTTKRLWCTLSDDDNSVSVKMRRINKRVSAESGTV